MYKKIRITLMCGLPGSGKSTIAREFAIKEENTFIVNGDQIREMLYGNYNYKEEDEGVIENIINSSIRIVMCEGKNIIIDECKNTLTSKHRKKLIEDLKNMIDDVAYCVGLHLDVDYRIIYCSNDNSLENRLKDNRGLSQSIWIKVFSDMKEIIEIPEKEVYAKWFYHYHNFMMKDCY